MPLLCPGPLAGFTLGPPAAAEAESTAPRREQVAVVAKPMGRAPGQVPCSRLSGAPYWPEPASPHFTDEVTKAQGSSETCLKPHCLGWKAHPFGWTPSHCDTPVEPEDDPHRPSRSQPAPAGRPGGRPRSIQAPTKPTLPVGCWRPMEERSQHVRKPASGRCHESHLENGHCWHPAEPQWVT